MPKRKNQRFAETATFPNFFQPRYSELENAGFFLRGNWHSKYFGNNNPVILELGCGKGEYTVGLARLHPDNNYIGMDIKGARMWRGAKTALTDQIRNVAFLRSQISLITRCFAPGEVSEIWITFPDPRPNKPDTDKRLTSPRFIGYYREILKPESIIHLKTDNAGFYDFTLQTIRELGLNLLYSTEDVYASGEENDACRFQTFYENMFLREDKKIRYLRFRAG